MSQIYLLLQLFKKLKFGQIKRLAIENNSFFEFSRVESSRRHLSVRQKHKLKLLNRLKIEQDGLNSQLRQVKKVSQWCKVTQS